MQPVTPTLGLNLPYVEGSMDGRTPRWADLLAMAREAESVGFDGLWISDHVGFGDPDGDWHGAWESWTLLSALAASTRRVTIGPYVAAVPFRNPALLTKMAETLDEVSGGRLVLGLGAGWNEAEFSAFDFPWPDRFDRFEDGLRIVTAMLRTGRADVTGRVTHARGARLEPRGPRGHGLPVMVGASGPRLLRLAAELADEWNGGLRTLDEASDLLDAVDEACAAVGRDPGTLRRSVEILVRPVVRAGDPPREERELRGSSVELASVVRAFGALGFDHLQIQLRPNRLDSVTAFGAVIRELRA